jgi:hypothetical protein
MTEATRLPADLAGALALIDTLNAQRMEAENDLSALRIEFDAAEVIDTPVTCEGCGVVLPMEAAMTTEDPVYLCGKCVGVESNTGLRYALAMAEASAGLEAQQAHEETTAHRLEVAMASIRELETVNARVCEEMRTEKAARRKAVALWTKQAETCRQLVGALESIISVVDKVLWSHTADAIINSAKSVLKQVQP